MLCSHKHKFIYFKTIKTAGTSVEIFFEKYCVPEGTHTESHTTRQLVTEAGIVGSRMDGKKWGDKFYNHMPAKDVRARLGDEIFRSYLKFCVVRNPYDKLISRFWWDLKPDEAKRAELGAASFSTIKEPFRKWIFSKAGKLVDDRDIYTIKGQSVMDRYVHFENLLGDMESVCKACNIEFEPERLGSYKSGIRIRPEHFSEYYDSDTQALVEREFNWELAEFGYELRARTPEKV